MNEQYFKSSTCKVEIKLKENCYNRKESLWEVRYRGKILQIPINKVQFELPWAADITSLWTVILDINEIESFSVKCDNVFSPYEYNR